MGVLVGVRACFDQIRRRGWQRWAATNLADNPIAVLMDDVLASSSAGTGPRSHWLALERVKGPRKTWKHENVEWKEPRPSYDAGACVYRLSWRFDLFCFCFCCSRNCS